MRWLRRASRQASHSASGVRPMSRHQPRLMLLLAGSLMVAKVRPEPVRRGVERPGAGGGGLGFFPARGAVARGAVVVCCRAQPVAFLLGGTRPPRPAAP